MRNEMTKFIRNKLLDICYNHFHNILRLFDILPSFTFTTSETMVYVSCVTSNTKPETASWLHHESFAIPTRHRDQAPTPGTKPRQQIPRQNPPPPRSTMEQNIKVDISRRRPKQPPTAASPAQQKETRSSKTTGSPASRNEYLSKIKNSFKDTRRPLIPRDRIG